MWKLMKLLSLFNGLKSIMHDLTLDELDELIDEVAVVYERYNVYVQSRTGESHLPIDKCDKQ
jgi:hypothetical protein